jgi:hypothetical protein
MKCKHCGLPRSLHVKATGNDRGRIVSIWKCPDGSGNAFPAMTDVKIELHYRAGEDHPWVASWTHPTLGSGEVVANEPALAQQLAGHKIEESLEEKSADEIATEQAIRER